MAKPMSLMMFGKYKGQSVDDVPTDYLIWVFGSFPKLRNKLREVLENRGLAIAQVERLAGRHQVLGRVPESDQKRRKRLLKPKRVRRSGEQKRANDVARAMGKEMPYPRYRQPNALRYFNRPS